MYKLEYLIHSQAIKKSNTIPYPMDIINIIGHFSKYSKIWSFVNFVSFHNQTLPHSYYRKEYEENCQYVPWGLQNNYKRFNSKIIFIVFYFTS